jgi:TonB family protein
MWAAIGAAIVVHVVVLVTVHAMEVSETGGFGQQIAHAAEAPRPELEPTCRGDALLAGAARVAMCGAPWQQDVDGCLDTARMYTLIDLSACDASPDKGTTVAMLEPRQMDRLKPIDPEPLLDTPQPPKPPPPVVPPPQPTPPAPAPPPPPPHSQPMQVVEAPKQTTDEAPDNARFLAENNATVKKETVARGAADEKMIAKSKPEDLTPKQNPRDASMQKPPDLPPGKNPNAPDVPGTLSMRNPGARSPAELAQDAHTRGSMAGTSGPLAFDGFVPRRGDGAIDQLQHQRSETPSGQGGAGGGAPQVANLKPSQDVLERALGGGSVDHLENVDNGDETALNAKRWVYASFFNRLKRQVAQNWDPASVWQRTDPTGQVYGFKTRVTEVRVSLTPTGELADIVVTNPSGVSELDDEAVRSFRAAAPFPNPPKELVSSDNRITFAFSFFFEIGDAHTAWRVIHE